MADDAMKKMMEDPALLEHMLKMATNSGDPSVKAMAHNCPVGMHKGLGSRVLHSVHSCLQKPLLTGKARIISRES